MEEVAERVEGGLVEKAWEKVVVDWVVEEAWVKVEVGCWGHTPASALIRSLVLATCVSGGDDHQLHARCKSIYK